MARMLGRYRSGGCYSGTPSNHRTHPDGGPDCAGHERDTRWRKRVEQREVARELATFPPLGPIGCMQCDWDEGDCTCETYCGFIVCMAGLR